MRTPGLKAVIGCFVLSLWIVSCETPFQPEISGSAAGGIVVEGYIEGGARPTPPFVILTRSYSFFDSLGLNELQEGFVHGATVKVSDGTREQVLQELCLSDLNEQQKTLLAGFLGFDPDSVAYDFCAYLDLTFSMLGVEGRTYQLHIDVGEEVLEATTTIPEHVGLDSLFFEPPPGQPNDTLARLKCLIDDPGDRENYYRYQTRINDQPFVTPSGSVVDDRFFNGQSFEFPLAKAEPPGTEFDPATFGLYRVGDRVELKWINIDRAHFDFWNTLEFNAANQGPFSSYTRILSNVEGGQGIWGGLSASYYSLEVAY